jgi:hypothetical protein
MWPRRRKTNPPPEPEDLQRARAADERATNELRQVRDQWPIVNHLHAELEYVLRRNHFGESIEEAFRRKVAGA